MCWPGAATYTDAAVLESTLALLTLGSFMRRLRAFISLQPACWGRSLLSVRNSKLWRGKLARDASPRKPLYNLTVAVSAMQWLHNWNAPLHRIYSHFCPELRPCTFKWTGDVMHPEICTSDSVTSDSMPTCHALGKKQVSVRIESFLARTYSSYSLVTYLIRTYLILFIFWCAASNTQFVHTLLYSYSGVLQLTSKVL